MKAKLSYLFFFLILVLSVTASIASIENINVLSSNRKYSQPLLPINYSNAGKSIEQRQFLNQVNGNKSAGKEEGTQIIQAQDATVNASVIQLSEAVASLIAVLFHYVNERYPLAFDPPRQFALFNILFRVIISPNAP